MTADLSVQEVWGETVGDATPYQTLKGPRAARSAAPVAAATTAIPDLSAEGYELLDVLGEGGVGVVYQAIQKTVDRKIAVKMIRPGVGRSAGEREKFVAEAMVTGRLDHPNIVPIHDLAVTADGQPFYTMKMVRGTPWSEVIGQQPVSRNLSILLDVCDAVSFAHSRGVIHRDLKPENVMLGEFGEVQLMDWGLGAAVSAQGVAAELSASQTAGGTPAYMAPEMVTGEDGPVGVYSDVYLLGAILFEIVSGKPPHAGRRVLETLENAHKNVIRPTEQTGVLLDIASKAMQTDPADRYAGVHEFKQALLDYQSHAESIHLCQKASEDLDRARENRDYDLFAQSLFGYRQALAMWKENTQASEGIAEAQLQYGACAFEKGDLDLAASTLDPACSAHGELTVQIREAQRRRSAAKRRLAVLRMTAISLTALTLAVLTVASIWINSAKRQAVIAKEQAESARLSESRQRRLAESATVQARQEEARATKALSDLEKAYADVIAAQEQEKRAQQEAAASERAATETRDQLARSGMLLDRSWWACDPATMAQAQATAARLLGQPVTWEITLPSGIGLDMVLVPPGEFVMGSPPDETDRAADEHLHRVRQTEPFYLGRFEVTTSQWQAVMGGLPSSSADQNVDPACPIISVPPQVVLEQFLPAIQAHAPEGFAFRLPTEAEWEYACRAGAASAYCSGDTVQDLDAVAWYLANGDQQVHPVGVKRPNSLGLYDMHGNAGELCADRYAAGFYLESPVVEPFCAAEAETLVLRGGSTLNAAEHCRSAYRSYVFHKNAYPFVGLRLALVRLPGFDAFAGFDQPGCFLRRNALDLSFRFRVGPLMAAGSH